MQNAAITGWGKCLPPAILSNEDLATLMDTTDQWIVSRTGIRERRISHATLGDLAYVASARALAAAGLNGKRSRSDRVRYLQSRRPGPEHGLRCAGANRRRCGRRHGRQHCLHQLSLWSFLGDRIDSNRCCSQRTRDRRGAHFTFHGLDGSRCRSVVWRRCGGRGVASDHPGRRTACGTAWVLRRCAGNSASAWDGWALCQPRNSLRIGAVAVRRSGNLQTGRARNGRGERERTWKVGTEVRRRRPRQSRIRPICESSKPSRNVPTSPWIVCMSTSNATATCPLPQSRWRYARHSKTAESNPEPCY